MSNTPEQKDAPFNVTLAVEQAIIFGKDKMTAAEVIAFAKDLHKAICDMSTGEAPPAPVEKPVPKVSIRASITPDYLICLHNGRRFKSLKRHLMAEYGQTPEQYRAAIGLPADYPMVAPNYATQRSELAKSMGLGKTRLGKKKAA